MFFLVSESKADDIEQADESTHKRKSDLDRSCIKRFRRDGKDFVNCELCIKYPATVKLHIRNQRLPKIATANGGSYRADDVENHLASEYHIACVNIEWINLLKKPNKVLTPMDVAISKAKQM